MNNMNTFAVLVFCIQALLIQNVFSQCSGSFGSDINNAALSYDSGLAASAPVAVSSGLGRSSAGFGYAGGFGAPGFGSTGNLGYEATNGAVYNGAGEGNVAVAGELPVAGNTAVFGHIPIQGSVSFGGNLPAAGFVTITGRCSCGCDNNY